jgi:hypothetical protein
MPIHFTHNVPPANDPDTLSAAEARAWLHAIVDVLADAAVQALLRLVLRWLHLL